MGFKRIRRNACTGQINYRTTGDSGPRPKKTIMVKSITTIICGFLVLLSVSSCRKEQEEPCPENGRVTFTVAQTRATQEGTFEKGNSIGVQTPISIKKNQSKDKGKKTDYIFNGLPDEVPVGRYHSWVVDTDGFPECLEITAVSQEGLVMALKHKEYDIHGIQFHPESVLTPDGKAMIANFLNA